MNRIIVNGKIVMEKEEIKTVNIDKIIALPEELSIIS
jgi:hypothetical protein